NPREPEGSGSLASGEWSRASCGTARRSWLILLADRFRDAAHSSTRRAGLALTERKPSARTSVAVPASHHSTASPTNLTHSREPSQPPGPWMEPGQNGSSRRGPRLGQDLPGRDDAPLVDILPDEQAGQCRVAPFGQGERRRNRLLGPDGDQE